MKLHQSTFLGKNCYFSNVLLYLHHVNIFHNLTFQHSKRFSLPITFEHTNTLKATFFAFNISFWQNSRKQLWTDPLRLKSIINFTTFWMCCPWSGNYWGIYNNNDKKALLLETWFLLVKLISLKKSRLHITRESQHTCSLEEKK